MMLSLVFNAYLFLFKFWHSPKESDPLYIPAFVCSLEHDTSYNGLSLDVKR